MSDFFIYKEKKLVGSGEVEVSNPYANAPWWVGEYSPQSIRDHNKLIGHEKFFDLGNPLLLLEPSFISFPPTTVNTISNRSYRKGEETYPPISLVTLKIANNSGTRILLHFPTGRKISHITSTPSTTVYNTDANHSSLPFAPIFIPTASTLVVPPMSVAAMPIQFIPENDGRIASLVRAPKRHSELGVYGNDYVVRHSASGAHLVPPSLLVFSHIKFSISYPVASDMALDGGSRRDCLLPCCGLVVPEMDK